MGTCPIDHSLEDVQKKLQEQASHLPADLYRQLQQFLMQELEQETLNETFHLLKKYDLADDAERQKRNMKMEALLDASPSFGRS